jgi:hypothetical protein
MERDYIRINKPSPLPDYASHLKELSDDNWQSLIFYHLLSFYKNHNRDELKNIIAKEQLKTYSRTEREIAKFIRKYLRNNREFSFACGLIVNGEITNDEDIEGNYDITISHSYWQNDFYFECKNLDLKLPNSGQSLVNKYVFYKYTKKQTTISDGGVYRYFNGKYAQNQNFGGMIGFVVDGDIKTIKNKIFEKIKIKFDISPEGDLKEIIDNSIEQNEFTFNSIHTRFNKEFILHHLLFDFTST